MAVTDQQKPRREPIQSRRLRWHWTLTAVVALAVIAVLVPRAVNRNKTPYPASALHAHLNVQIVDATQVQKVIDQLAGPGRLTALAPTHAFAPQVVVGQLKFDTPRNAPSDGEYALFVIDNDEHRLVPAIWGVGPVGTRVTSGYDSGYDAIARQYGWLAPLGVVPNGDDTRVALSWLPDKRGPVTFYAMLARDSLPITHRNQQLTIALVFRSGSGHIYWALRL